VARSRARFASLGCIFWGVIGLIALGVSFGNVFTPPAEVGD
jgi:hypothetical protein